MLYGKNKGNPYASLGVTPRGNPYARKHTTVVLVYPDKSANELCNQV